MKTAKCPHNECEAYGACGHHGPGGACLAASSRSFLTDADVLTMMAKLHAEKSATITTDDFRHACMEALQRARRDGLIDPATDLEKVIQEFSANVTFIV